MNMNKYGIAAAEVLEILKITDEKDVKKIPQSFIDFLKKCSTPNYIINFDHSKKIKDLTLSEKTQELLGYIYIRWWSDVEKKKEYKKKIIEYEAKKELFLRKKYNLKNN